jgi:pyruvate/2-oxoglutarate dehydrogenase complex dihydrolipoamide acyltransferase (E2) component
MSYRPYYLKRRKRQGYERLSFKDRWVRDGIDTADVPGACGLIEVDMGAASPLLKRLKDGGSAASYAPILVRAVALAIRQLPDLYMMVGGNTRYYPQQADIGLLVAGETAVAPTLTLRDCGNKSLEQLAAEIQSSVVAVRQQEQRMMAVLEKWGWIVPFSLARRSLFRLLRRSVDFRLKAGAAINITYLPHADSFTPMRMASTAVVTVGGVRDRAVAVDGQVVIRPTTMLSIAMDHSIWDGMCAARFATTLKGILEKPGPEF